MKKLLTTMLIATALQLLGQENITYQLPPAEILQLADFDRPPGIMMDHERKYVVLTYRNTYKTLNDLNQEEMRLGGLRINPATNISSTLTYITNLKLRKAAEKEPRQVSGLPQNAQIGYMLWSPNEEKIAFTNTSDQGVELWVLDVASATAEKLVGAKLNANMGNPMTWFADSKNLLVRLLPANRPALIDYSKNLPLGPVVSTTTGEVSQNRTYQDLLKNPTDEVNFENIISSEIHKIGLDKTATLLFEKAMYAGETFSPDGNYIMITTIHKPFSYIVPLNRFPKKTTIYSNTGALVAEVDATDLIEIMPKGFMATTAGKRGMNWRADKHATLYYVQALDGGDPAKDVTHRDALFTLEAPFTGNGNQIAKTVQRFGGIIWGDDETAIMFDSWYDTRNQRTYLINPSQPDFAPKVIADRNYQDIYSDPGDFQTRRNQYQRQELAIENGNVFLVGDGYSTEGQFPFIDKMELSTQKTTRLYQSKDKNRMERIMSIEDFKKGIALVQLQSKTEYPNYYLRDYGNKGKLTAITAFKNPFESLNNVHKEVINYTRADGVALSGTLYLPPGYDMKKKEKLPLLIWAYPREFKDKNSAGQSTANPNEFTFPYYGSFVYWVMRGYVVLDDASFPIVGEGDKEPNDNFIQQLVANAEAAINAVNELGYINTKKVAVGGHSYGAFMTANLLTHSNLFACGIARSGAYNRTLTPFGFQSEQRNYWDVPEIYNTMSPFMNAEKMKTPMLLVHGEADNNPGTFTLQTERYFQALKGLGAPARMVLLPKESHGYVARENIMHLLWEQDQFLEKYLKDAPAK